MAAGQLRSAPERAKRLPIFPPILWINSRGMRRWCTCRDTIPLRPAGRVSVVKSEKLWPGFDYEPGVAGKVVDLIDELPLVGGDFVHDEGIQLAVGDRFSLVVALLGAGANLQLPLVNDPLRWRPVESLRKLD